MTLLTRPELLEVVEELREMAAASPKPIVRDALITMADRYAARATEVTRPRLRNRSQATLSHACAAPPSANG